MHKAVRLVGRAFLGRFRGTNTATSARLVSGEASPDPAKDSNAANFTYGLKEEYAFRSGQEKARKASTVDTNETDKFRSMASQWWDPDGECKPLHSMNQLRYSISKILMNKECFFKCISM